MLYVYYLKQYKYSIKKKISVSKQSISGLISRMENKTGFTNIGII